MTSTSLEITDTVLDHLQRCVDLADEALEAGDKPFGSILVGGNGQVLLEDRNRVNTVNATYHPELAIARWAAENMSLEERAAATVYTSGEHCPMCAAAHAWAGLGRIVYAISAEQLGAWLDEIGFPASPVAALSIRDVVPQQAVTGPVPQFAKQLKALHQKYHEQLGGSESAE